LYRALAPRVRAIPGVDEAGLVTNLPLATRLGDLNFRIEGRTVAEGDVSPRADWQVVTPGYLEAMEVRLVRGRLLTAQDNESAPGAVVISRALADRYWPAEDPMGTRFELGGNAGPGWVTVVGIVADVRHSGLDQVTGGQMYLPHAQFRFWGGGGAARSMNLAVRSSLPVNELRAALADAVGGLDPTLPLARVRTMEDVRRASTALPRLLTALVSAFSLLALLLTAVGLYGVVSYAVSQRTREFGIRSALGAPATATRSMVLRQGLKLAVWGVGIGMIGVLLGARLLGGILYDVQPTDPMSMVGSAALLTLVALGAAYLPARRATRVDPVATLRVD